MSIEHYENFPVASLLVPRRYRPAIETLYRFARSADDLADTPWAAPDEKRAALEGYREDLKRLQYRQAPHYALMAELGEVIRDYHLPFEPFYDLLSAFTQDISIDRYADEAQLMDYCRRSANPVGRLLLALWSIPMTPEREAASDAICSALQRINFLQDVAIDAELGRTYLTDVAMTRHGVLREDVLKLRLKVGPAPSPALKTLILEEAQSVRELMLRGAPLLSVLPYRLRLELKAIMAGGLRIIDKIEALGGDVVLRRPKLSIIDLPALLFRILFQRFDTPLC